MKILNKTTYTTTILEVEHNGEIYTVRHAEDFDGNFVNEWEILTGDGDFIQDVLVPATADELYETLTNYAKDFVGVKPLSSIESDYAAILAEQLAGDCLEYAEFVSYIEDYYFNSEEYKIDQDSEYYDAIAFAYHNTEDMYEHYLSQFNN